MSPKMRVMSPTEAITQGFSSDKRRRRRQHRLAARDLLRGGGFFNGFSARGSTMHSVALWHLFQARYAGR